MDRRIYPEQQETGTTTTKKEKTTNTKGITPRFNKGATATVEICTPA
jgi:hypothetical protein